ncbi:MAG: VOC family protein [Sphingomonadaceae bacterium]
MTFRVPGRILAVTVNTGSGFDQSLADWCGELGFEVAEEGRVTPDLARSWGAPAMVANRMALLHAPGGAGGLVRLVEGSAVPEYRPLRSYGWAAFEFSVADGPALHERLDTSAFQVLGAPKPVPGFDTFIPFQVVGRAGEVLYLNTVLKPHTDDLDLPLATAAVDQCFIAVLAAEDRAATLAFHVERLGFEEGGTFSFPYRMINQSFGLPDSHETVITMTRTGRMPASEIDQYPPDAIHRARAPGELPPGNSMVSFAVESLEGVTAPFIEPPVVREGPLYAGRRAASLWGPSGELIELVEA